MNTEEIARIVGDQRTYFKTHATFDVDARRRALVSLRDAVRRTRPILPMHSRPIWESRMTRHICARSARRFPRFVIRSLTWLDGVVRACVRVTLPTP